MTISSCEAEYVAAFYATCQALWLEMILEELYISDRVQIKLLVNN